MEGDFFLSPEPPGRAAAAGGPASRLGASPAAQERRDLTATAARLHLIEGIYLILFLVPKKNRDIRAILDLK